MKSKAKNEAKNPFPPASNAKSLLQNRIRAKKTQSRNKSKNKSAKTKAQKQKRKNP
jgi:hypothetical protein